MQKKLTTTFELLKEHHACSDGLELLINYLGKDYPEDKAINLLTILESNGVAHCLWALRASIEDSQSIARLIAADCAESVLYIYQQKYPGDDRPEKAIKAAREFANGLITKQELHAAYAAAAAAYAADAAAYAADAAAYAAAAAAYGADAADAAAYAAAAAAAADAAVYAADAAAAAADAAVYAADAAAYAAAYAADAAAYAAAYAAAAAAKNREKQKTIIKRYLLQD